MVGQGWYLIFGVRSFVPPQWREGLIVNCLRREIRRILGIIGHHSAE
ncbi:hypothetical protein GBAR_LOCUS17978, partial [Geodia barretti]